MKIKTGPIIKYIKSYSYILYIIAILVILMTVLYYVVDILNFTRIFISVRRSENYLPSSYIPTPVLEEDSHTLTWAIHMYPPLRNAGSEWMAHAMNLYLIRTAGWKVNVILNEVGVNEFERVHIINRKNKLEVQRSITHSTAIMSQYDNEQNAVMTAIRAKRPIVCVMHNNYRKKYLTQYQLLMPKNLYLIHNSYWIKEYYSSHNIPSIVVYPPVYWRDYQTETTREYVTLINLNKNKGGKVLINIAKAMPEVKFMGVKGGYDSQIQDKRLRNVEYVPNTSHIKDIYAKTGILLVPSKEESWGRVAVEAMSSGIPVVAHPAPGLLESCGEAGIFCDRDDTAAWVAAIQRLQTDKDYYKSVSDRCLARAKELDPQPQLAVMAEWLKGLKWQD